MSLGKKSNLPEGELMYLRIKTKDQDDKEVIPAVFTVSKKNQESNKWETVPKTESAVSGDLFRIDLGKGVYQEKEYKTVKIYLRDNKENEIYVLDLRYNLLSRNLFNSLVNLTSFNGISISLYKTKGKKPENKDKEFSAISIWQDDAIVKGKFRSEEMPKAEEVKNSKGVVLQRDFSALDDFLEKELAELKVKLEKAKTPTTIETHETVSIEDATDEDGDDKKIPF